MNRRKFLTAVAGVPFGAPLVFSSLRAADEAPIPSVPAPEVRRFEVTTRVTLPAANGPAQLWLPLAQTAGGYQTVVGIRWQGNDQTQRVHDARYGAQILHNVWDADTAKHPHYLEVMQTVVTFDRSGPSFLSLTEAERRFWTTPTASAPVDGIILETARKITAGWSTPREQVHALYNWVINHTHRDPDTPGCGTGDVAAVLTGDKLGGKCADINGLMVGLARAAGFPARDVYGLRVGKSRSYSCLGREGDVSKAQHCRCEVFLDDEGWLPLDPADVRKVILEEKLPPDSDQIWALRDRCFNGWEMNWVAYNSATDIVLPGDTPHKPDFPFLMYPCAVTGKGQVSCLDPAHFRYEITSRELTT